MKKTLIIIGMSIITIFVVSLLFFKGKEGSEPTKKKQNNLMRNIAHKGMLSKKKSVK